MPRPVPYDGRIKPSLYTGQLKTEGFIASTDTTVQTGSKLLSYSEIERLNAQLKALGGPELINPYVRQTHMLRYNPHTDRYEGMQRNDVRRAELTTDYAHTNPRAGQLTQESIERFTPNRTAGEQMSFERELADQRRARRAQRGTSVLGSNLTALGAAGPTPGRQGSVLGAR